MEEHFFSNMNAATDHFAETDSETTGLGHCADAGGPWHRVVWMQNICIQIRAQVFALITSKCIQPTA